MNDIQTLRSALPGRAFSPGDDGYDTLRRPWNLSVDQYPALVVMAESVDDVRAAVQLARRQGLGLAVQSSGHGAVHPCDGGIVVNVSRLDGVRVDPDAGVARVGAGARWRAVLEAADPHGLIGLSGTATNVGVAGYTLGGGLGILMRRFGFAADSLIGADVVTADGETLRADGANHPDLLWALKGGSGNFGVVTSLDVRLHPVRKVVNGMLAYPGERAAEVLSSWAEWTRQVPDDVTSAAMLVTVPPVPAVPEPIRGQHLVIVRSTVAGADTTQVDQLRDKLGAPLMDTTTTSGYLQAAMSGMEPEDPSTAAGRSTLLTGLSAGTIARITEAAGPGSPINPLEIRHLGGAAAHAPDQPSAVSHRDAAYVLAMHAAPADAAEADATVRTMEGALSSITDDAHGGTFINFLHHGSTAAEVRSAYDAATYRRLTEVKRTYDPHNTFRFNHNIEPAE
ncbi:FAD/FMN-containing dehydrogenase [Haloactinopolyspora alba]|uniref:FAD/FMN-containing dehydrogenase n=1 Tax=Haloactinopolyspora alba TaxID=648780 RepID=A0A2P8DY93_9ACTN|nr:FAD-binding oxidoreductase [Haloactinopolyspora alba]PSL02196.1 FAD/FMN-containing dehydrogenase [Haloactinopolyspora alba]